MLILLVMQFQLKLLILNLIILICVTGIKLFDMGLG